MLACVLSLALLAFHMPSIRVTEPASSSRISGVSASALTETPVLQHQPPSSPPPVANGGGGGGDDDSSAEFLRLLSPVEQCQVLSEWLQRSRIYKLTDNAELAAQHQTAIADLEALQRFVRCRSARRRTRAVVRLARILCHLTRSLPHGPLACAQDTTDSGPNGRRMLLGLFDREQLWALAAAEVSRTNGLVVSSLCVYPAEVNDASSTASLRLVHALHLLADAIETPINLKDSCRFDSELAELLPEWKSSRGGELGGFDE
jgi:hypothetical protein